MEFNMGFSSTRFFLGILVNVEIWILLPSNIFCLLCIYRGQLHTSKDNFVYAISGFNLLVATAQMVVHAVYVGPSIISGNWFFSGQSSLGMTVTSTWFLGLWYLSSIIQMLMALNRVLVIFAPRRFILTPRRLKIVLSALSLFALSLVVYSQLLSPCCRITPDPRFYGYSYLVFANQTENKSMIFVDLPLDTISSVICAASYISMFFYLYRMGKYSNNSSYRREMKLCFQFLIIFLTYTVTWGTFFLFPHLGIQVPEAYVTTTIVFMANCGVNSIIYLTMNKEIRTEARKILGLVEKSRNFTLQPVIQSTSLQKSCA